MKLKIKITKQILEESKMCGVSNFIGRVGEHCAIALAVREIFPKAVVGRREINPFGFSKGIPTIIDLPDEATYFIDRFDRSTVEKRVALPEFEFEINIPEKVIESISLPEIEKIISNSETLELIE